MEQQQQAEYGLIFWLHLVALVFMITAWAFLSWWWLVIGEVLLQVQYFTVGCVLSKAEFEDEKEACVPYYLDKWGIMKNKDLSRRLVRDVLPWLVIAFALIWQIGLGFKPLLF
jgi:hypothetical protein